MKPEASIDVSDLIARSKRIPWVAGGVDPAVGLDCAGLAWLMQRRRGYGVPDYALVAGRSTTEPERALADFLALDEAAWLLLGDSTTHATRPGDIIVSRGRTGPHCSTLVNAATRKAITTSSGTGVQLIGADRIPGVTAVYRWIGATA